MSTDWIIEGCIPARYVGARSGAVRLRDAILGFQRMHPGAHIESINDRTVLASCEGCNLPIFDDETYCCDEDGICWHKTCPAE